ncbi:hypothetical protein [Gymnodinialimonas sp. 57CJ19]|uniref:hypothetical protein n=1 Tax=Gymnodinialimonas sp. 57CJ19 TaxID=3138498 RepID=UPI0031345BB6
MIDFRKPSFLISMALIPGGIGWNIFNTNTSSTEVTVEVMLHPSGEVITDLAQIDAFETYIPAEVGEDGGYERYGPIFNVEGQSNVFHVDGGVQAGFAARVGATDLGMIATTGGGAETRNITFPATDGLVRLSVQTDSPPEFFVQATSDLASGTLDVQSQGAPEDGEMVFLLPPGEWTFSAVDDAFDQNVVVTVPPGDIVEASLDLRADN